MLKRCLWKAICMLAYIGLSLLGKYSQTQKHPTILLSLYVDSCNILVRSTDPWPRKSHFEVFCYRGKKYYTVLSLIVLTFFIRNIFGIWKAFEATLVAPGYLFFLILSKPRSSKLFFADPSKINYRTF